MRLRDRTRGFGLLKVLEILKLYREIATPVLVASAAASEFKQPKSSFESTATRSR